MNLQKRQHTCHNKSLVTATVSHAFICKAHQAASASVVHQLTAHSPTLGRSPSKTSHTCKMPVFGQETSRNEVNRSSTDCPASHNSVHRFKLGMRSQCAHQMAKWPTPPTPRPSCVLNWKKSLTPLATGSPPAALTSPWLPP
jgi:hypothetical protein